MRFIKDNISKKDSRKGYLLIIDTMVGDADGYEKIEVGCFQENELHLLEEVINVCDRMTKEYPHGRGGDDLYDHIEGFERWFSENYDGDYSDIQHLTSFDWCYSSDGYCSQNSIDGYKVVYLDNGNEYKVDVIK